MQQQIPFNAFLLVVLASLVCVRCIDPLRPDVSAPELPLVVEGLIVNGPGPHEVSLRRAAVYEQSIEGINERVSGARVTVSDGQGNSVIMHEAYRTDRSAPRGVYRTKEGDLPGVPGRAYSVEIELSDGSLYASRPETLRTVPDIDSLYARESKPGSGVVEANVRFKESPEQGQYYRWSVRGIYTFVFKSGAFGGYCFARDRQPTTNLNTASDQLINGQAVDWTLRRFFSGDGLLDLPYAMRATQMSLSPNAYEYWSTVQNQAENVGSTFQGPPASIIGNVQSVDDPDEEVLGYVQVSSVDTEDLCIFKGDYPSYETSSLLPSSCRSGNSESTGVEPQFRIDICPRLTPPRTSP